MRTILIGDFNIDAFQPWYANIIQQIENLFSELILIPKADFYEILKYCFDKKHNFIYIDVNKPHDKMFHKCFNELSFTSENEIDL